MSSVDRQPAPLEHVAGRGRRGWSSGGSPRARPWDRPSLAACTRWRGRLVVVGGDAGGMAAATQARRRDPSLEIVALEKGGCTSYSACGIPFLVGGEVGGGVDALVAPHAAAVPRRPPHRRPPPPRGHRHRPRPGPRRGPQPRPQPRPHHRLRQAPPRHRRPPGPPRPARHRPAVRAGVQTLDDADALLAQLAATGGECERAVVVGGGYIGLEMAEAFTNRGRQGHAARVRAPRDGAPSTRTWPVGSATPCGASASTCAPASAATGFEPGVVHDGDRARWPPTSWCSASASRPTALRWRRTPASASA